MHCTEDFSTDVPLCRVFKNRVTYQSMDLRNPWIVLRKVAIDTLRNKVWICCAFHGLSTRYFAQSMD